MVRASGKIYSIMLSRLFKAQPPYILPRLLSKKPKHSTAFIHEFKNTHEVIRLQKIVLIDFALYHNQFSIDFKSNTIEGIYFHTWKIVRFILASYTFNLFV